MELTIKREAIGVTVKDGKKTHKLELRKYSIADAILLSKLQKDIFNEEMSQTERTLQWMVSRVVAGLFDEKTGERFFKIDSIQDFPYDLYGLDFIAALHDQVDNLNPVNLASLDAKKKS